MSQSGDSWNPLLNEVGSGLFSFCAARRCRQLTWATRRRRRTGWSASCFSRSRTCSCNKGTTSSSSWSGSWRRRTGGSWDWSENTERRAERMKRSRFFWMRSQQPRSWSVQGVEPILVFLLINNCDYEQFLILLNSIIKKQFHVFSPTNSPPLHFYQLLLLPIVHLL